MSDFIRELRENLREGFAVGLAILAVLGTVCSGIGTILGSILFIAFGLWPLGILVLPVGYVVTVAFVTLTNTLIRRNL